MKTRFLLNFLTTSSKRSGAGFAMPMVIMAGLVITVVAAAIAMKGMNDQNQVTSQAAKHGSEAVAEAGVSQMQNFLLGSKFLALYPKTKWETGITVDANGNVSINDPDLQGYVTSVATQLAASALSGSDKDVCNTLTPNSDQIAVQEASIKSALRDIRTVAVSGKDLVAGDPSKGQFRVTSFDYQGYNPTTGLSSYPPGGQPWLAQMTIEGTIPGKDAATTVTTTMPISVDITPKQTPFNASTMSPGLWVRNGGINDPSRPETSYDDSSGEIDGDVVISDCGGSVSDAYLDSLKQAQQARGYNAYRAETKMPEIPQIPSGVTPTLITSNSASLNPTGSPAADGYYYYQRLGDLDGLTIDHTGGKKYRIYVSGNIGSGTGNQTINSNCKNTSGCVASNLQLFGTGATGQVCMKGNDNRQVDAFVLAPNYAMGKTGNGNFYGTFIVGSYGKIQTCGSNNGDLAITSTEPSGSVPNDFTVVASSPYPMPLIGTINGWKSEATGTIPGITRRTGGYLVSQAPPIISSSSSSSLASSSSSSSLASSSSSSSLASSSSSSSLASGVCTDGAIWNDSANKCVGNNDNGNGNNGNRNN